MKKHQPITHPKSICIVRLSAIGDVCHAVAAVQAIQKRHPQAEITWIIGKIEAQLLMNLPKVKFIVFDKSLGIRGYTDLSKRLEGIKFDILLHMQVALRASLATLFINAKEKWGFDSKRAKEGQWLFTNRKIEPQNQPHVVDGFFGFAQAIGVSKNQLPQWDMPISHADENWCKALTADRPYIVISPAASKQERNWLIQHYAKIADHAVEKGFLVYLSGGPTELEKSLATDIIQECNAPVTDLVGKTSLTQLLSLLRSAELVIAPDSGPAHMATTVGTPVIGLYAHSNPNRTGPYNSRETTVSVYENLLEKQTGKSIEENRWGKRVKGGGLMRLITLESVKENFDKIVSSK